MESLLRDKKIKITEARLEILKVLSNSKFALSYRNIQEVSNLKLDKVTTYRTLDTFEKKGIIHSVPAEEGGKLYSYCLEGCKDHHHLDNHIHFTCEKCDETTCLYNSEIPQVDLPENYQFHSSKLIVRGHCPYCN
jgi:Fur family ferric uptake transcriptional regulator